MSLFSGSKSDPSVVAKRTTVDKDLKRFVQLEKATTYTSQRNLNLGFGLLFLLGVWVFMLFRTDGDGFSILAIAAIVGGYMAMNIGANDVANNVGPAVGSKALTLLGALAIAAIFEAGGALIAGGDVVITISKSIISPDAFADKSIFIWAMLAAVIGGPIPTVSWVLCSALVLGACLPGSRPFRQF